jgi:hypothetical protein
VVATRRLNPHLAKIEEGGTRKFECVRLGGVEGWATRRVKPTPQKHCALAKTRDSSRSNPTHP